jgi:hypothetical protein
MKIALIDTRTAKVGESLGTLLSLHDTMAAVFKANQQFQNKVGPPHVVTKIVTIERDVLVGELVKPSDLAGEGNRCPG